MISKMRRKAEQGFTLIELMIVVAIIGILAAVAIPAFMKYIKKSKTTEARQFVKKIYEGAREYYMDTPQPTVAPIAPQFPNATTSTITPASTACAGGTSTKVAPVPSLWETASWNALKFSVDDPSLFQYTYVATTLKGLSAAYTARANGDLDCDAKLSTFEMLGALDTQGSPTGGAGISRIDDLE